MTDSLLASWAEENFEGEEFNCKKGRVYVISCGTRTYTWFVKEGVLFTTAQSSSSDDELANTIWQKGGMIHSLDEDIMLPLHALTDCVLVRYPSEDLNAKIREDAALGWQLAEHYHDQFTSTLAKYKHAALDVSEDPLAYLENMFAQIEGLEDEHIGDATLASFMGMHRVSVSRVRKKLEGQRTASAPSDGPS